MLFIRAVNSLQYLITINRKLITHFFICSKCTFKGDLLSMQMHVYTVFVIVNQLTTQNNDKYCPETLTGTAFNIKQYAQIITC